MAGTERIQFMLNGRVHELENVDPTTLLVNYLHQPDVGMTGTKKGCGQGGCGACTVMLSRYDERVDDVVHTSINSCMRPVAALDGMAVTTTEGVGNIREGVGPVQWEIAANNGSQCGYCTPGWVMNMHSYLAAHGDAKPTGEDVQAIFDGNICRCTGYRPILYAMQHFTEGFEPHEGAMACQIDPADCPKQTNEIVTPVLPDRWKQGRGPLAIEHQRHQWYRPLDMAEARDRLAENPGAKLVAGNTSIGVYDLFTEDPSVYIDIGHLRELRDINLTDDELTVGSALTYSEFLAELATAIDAVRAERAAGLNAINYLAGRTAGHIVRNAASLAGNTMLVIHHIAEGTPFPSDLFTAFSMAGVEVTVASPEFGGVERLGLLEFAHACADSADLLSSALIVSYHIPFAADGVFAQTYKTALREENSHSIVNAGFQVRLDTDTDSVAGATFVIGGIGPVAFRSSEAEEAVLGRHWDTELLADLVDAVTSDAWRLTEATKERMSSVPDEGFSDDYRVQLAQGFAYKFWIEVAEHLGIEVPDSVRSAVVRDPRPVSTGTQRYNSYADTYPINRPFVKLGAFMQATGEAIYTHDMALPPRGLHASFVSSAAAVADFNYIDESGECIEASEVVSVLRRHFDGIEFFITGADVPYNNDQSLPGPAGTTPQIPDPLFCQHHVTTFGQSIALVLAADPVVAEAAAHFVSTKLIRYEIRDDVLLTIDEAIEADSFFPDADKDQNYPSHIWKITRADTDRGWVDGENGKATVSDVACHVTKSRLEVGAQIHFYMETQSAMAVPGEDGTLVVHSSTQSPNSVQSLICSVLGMPSNKVTIRVTRLGGAYGGKTTRSPRPAAAAAVAAYVTGRPIHIALRRETDTAMFGNRHPARGDVAIAVATDGNERGKIMGLDVDYVLNGGNTYDCSMTISDVLQLRSDNSYMVPNYETRCDIARTNTVSNGAFRSVGAMQGIMAIEDAIEGAAVESGISAEEIRAQSLYEQGDEVPDGQRLDHCYLRDVWEYTLATSDFKRRLEAVHAFNAENRWVKRGISIIPVKYGSGYNATFLEQAGALLEVFDGDGSVLVRQGGVDMGQGLYTKISQVAAHVLDVPLTYVRVAETDTSVVPNPVSTGASTGSEFNGTAVRAAGKELRARLEEYAASKRQAEGEKWCEQHGIDYWNDKDGWRTPLVDKHGIVRTNPDGSPKTKWQNLVRMAGADRLNLSAQARVSIQGGGGLVDADTLTFKDGAAVEVVNEFTGFTFSAACSEVEVDILTGETRVLAAHLVYDMGHSLNPAIDIGQVEGAYVQGLGYVTTEQLVWQSSGPDRGVANTLNTWTYKPPAHTGVPLEMHVDLYPRERSDEVSEDPNLLFSAKEVGEPPFVLATTAFLAIKRAVYASRVERDLDGWFTLNAPATVQEVRTAAAVDGMHLTSL